MNNLYRKCCAIVLLLLLALIVYNFGVEWVIQEKISNAQFLAWSSSISASKIEHAIATDYSKASVPDDYILSYDEEKRLVELLNQIDAECCMLNKDIYSGPVQFALYVSGEGKSYLFKPCGDNSDLLYVVPKTTEEVAEYSVGNFNQFLVSSHELSDFIITICMN